MNTKPVLASALFALAVAAAAPAADPGYTPGSVPAATTAASHVSLVAGSGNAKQAVIEAGTDPSSVEIHFANAQRVSNAFGGGVEVVSKDGSLWHYRPHVYQTVNGKEREIAASFKVVDKDRVSLVVGKIDPTVPLVVSPVL